MDKKCQERIDFYKENPENLKRINPDFDGSSESWFAAGWQSKTNSLTASRVNLRTLVVHDLPKDGSIPFKVFHEISKAIQALGGEPLDMSEIIPAYLERYKPIRIVMCESPDGLEGLIENSFSMNYHKNRVNIFWSGKAYSMLGEHEINGIEWAEHNAKKTDYIFDPLDPMCPVTVDWAAWLSASSKFYKRNAPFSKKIFETEEEDEVLK